MPTQRRAPSKLHRRRFLQNSAAAASGLALAPTIVPSSCFGANDRVAVGCIGVKNQGKGNLNRFMSADCDIVAICDVDTNVRADALKVVTDAGKTAHECADYRELLDRDGIDAVVVTTPDHWHALITIHACQAGKDVYCEKPLSLTIADGRRMVEAARENERIVQTGSQQRSGREFRTACELVRNGAIGEIHTVLAGIADPNHPGALGPNTDPPSHLDYNMWLGPARNVPYNEKRVHYNFRFWWDYSGGQMTNWGAHHIDIAQWALGMDGTGPVSVEGTATFHPQMVHEVTETCRLTHTYSNGIKLIVGQGQDDIPMGTTFIGTVGKIHVNRGTLESDPIEIVQTPIEITEHLYESNNHVGNFLDCMRSRELPICDVEIGHRSATVCHLGNIVARLGRSIQWDPVNERIVDDPDAHAMTDRDYREPWTHDMRLARE